MSPPTLSEVLHELERNREFTKQVRRYLRGWYAASCVVREAKMLADHWQRMRPLSLDEREKNLIDALAAFDQEVGSDDEPESK